jgi:hypothetical protein
LSRRRMHNYREGFIEPFKLSGHESLSNQQPLTLRMG